jgi:cell division protein FtsB
MSLNIETIAQPQGDEIVALRNRIADLERENADLVRQNKQLREAVDALLQPAPSELLSENLTHASRIKTSDR